ncbi:hypothetical protein BKI52_43190 [marine bacterium AO1-C]|nr:hypothetical protein BKI52_43190 [marine bacterium AO1-C]
MKKFVYTFVALLLLSITTTFAQSSENRNFGNFSKLDVSGVANIILKPGNSNAANIKVSGNISLDELKTEVRGRTLYISLKKRHRGYRNIDVDIELTYKQLEALDLSGAVSIRNEAPIKANRFYLESSGAGSLKLAFDVKTLECEFSGASSVKLRGSADKLDLDLSGAGSVNAYDLVANIVKSETSGAGSIRVNAQKEIYASVSGVGSIRYKGNPGVVRTNKSGFGTIRKAN